MMKTLNEISTGSLSGIFLKVEQLKQLQKQVGEYLPEELKAHCHVANFREGVLVLAVASSAWTTKLRYVLPELMSTLRQQAKLHQLISIDYYVEPDFKKLFLS